MTITEEGTIEQIRSAALEVVRLSHEKYEAEKSAREFVEATVKELVGQTNPANGKDYSLTSAEDFAKKSDAYRALKDTIHATENALLVAHASYEMTLLRAKLAVKLVGVEA